MMLTATPKQMTAIEITMPGGPEVLRPVQRAVPQPSDGEVLIRVDAAGVNRPDVLQRRGHYPPPPGASDIPGLEVAGTIVEVGGGVTRWAVADRVCALVAGGGYAEYCVAPGPQCLPIPENVEVVPAAAIPETFFTVWTIFSNAARFARESACSFTGARAASEQPRSSSRTCSDRRCSRRQDLKKSVTRAAGSERRWRSIIAKPISSMSSAEKRM